jgi:hypothetical protein
LSVLSWNSSQQSDCIPLDHEHTLTLVDNVGLTERMCMGLEQKA